MQSGNSLYAIVHAKYGKHLNEQDYKALVGAKSVSEIVMYLRSHTVYANALEGIRGDDLHRGHLEQLIKHWVTEEENRIARFEKGVGVKFYNYTFQKNSINEILHFLRLLCAGREKEYVLFMPRNTSDYPAVNLKKLSESTNLIEVIASVKDKHIKEVLLEVQTKQLTGQSSLDYTLIEFALRRYLEELGLELARSYSKKSYMEMCEIYGIWCEIENVERIYRMKRFGIQDSKYIKSFLFDRYYKIKPSMLEKMIQAKDENEVFELFNSTYYKKYRELVRYHDINNYARCIYHLIMKHYFTFSTDPVVSVVAYNKLCETEMHNLYRIIESVRYGLDKKEISKNLAGYREV